MRKLYIILFLIIVSIGFIISRNLDAPFISEENSRKLAHPPIEGKWIVEKYIIIREDKNSKTEGDSFIGKIANFSDKGIVFDSEICQLPNYKVKRVNSKNYFWDNFKVKPKAIGIDTEYTQVITVNSKDNFFDEYIKLDENHIIKPTNNHLLFLIRQRSSSSEALGQWEWEDYKELATEKERETRSKSGLLLALKYKKLGNSKEEYTYRTLWISNINNQIMDIEEKEDILLPRMNGFWRVGVNNSILWAEPLVSNETLTQKENITEIKNGSILFVGNDYMSIDNGSLKVIPLDNLSNVGIKISKVGVVDSSIRETYSNNFNEVNWGVFRRGGRWILRGRTNYDEQGKFRDFDITYATPKNLITYDELYPSFHTFKTKIPEALDAFSSPNRDFAVIITKEELLVVTISGNNIGEIKQRYKLKKGETPVMAHWALGYYVDEWGKRIK